MGNTPLHEACAHGHVRVVQRLLANAQFPHMTKFGYLSKRRPPAVNARNDLGRTPLHVASTCNPPKISIVKILLDAGGSAEVLDNEKNTALDICTGQDVFQLLRSRAEVYNRRERLATTELKAKLFESETYAPVREDTKLEAGALAEEVRALRQAVNVVQRRLATVDKDVIGYKKTGEYRMLILSSPLSPSTSRSSSPSPSPSPTRSPLPSPSPSPCPRPYLHLCPPPHTL